MSKLKLNISNKYHELEKKLLGGKSKQHITIKIKKQKKEQLNVLDLFCGCGGMTRGLVDAGLNVVAGIDIWDKAIDSYGQNFGHMALCADLTKLTPVKFEKMRVGGVGGVSGSDGGKKKIDIIVGGPPCQGFSIAGKRDKNDPRNSLFMEYVKYLNFYKPKAFIIENVMGILSMKTVTGEKVIDIILSCLTKKYNVRICKLYASDFEVPQNRRRVIIFGVRKDLGIEPQEPTAILSKVCRIPVKTVLLNRPLVDKSYFLSDKAIAGIKKKKIRSKLNGTGFGAQFLKLDMPSYTIPARYWKDGYDALVHYNDTEIRRLTILELKRIQSFPDNFILVGNKKEQIMQIGNAVASRFAYHLGKHIIKTLQ